MEFLTSLERMLDSWFVQKAPFQLPDKGRRALAHAMWWLALIFGVLQALAVIGFWHAAHTVNVFVDYANHMRDVYGPNMQEAGPHHLGAAFYLALIMLAVDAALLLFAVPQLKKLQKAQGWDFLYYSLLLNLLYGLSRVFTDVGDGGGQLLSAAISFVIGGYLLFQIRNQFIGAKQTVAKAPTSKPAAHHKK